MTITRTVASPAKALQLLTSFALCLLGIGLTGCRSSSDAHAADPTTAPIAPVVKAQKADLTSALKIASELLPFQEINVYAKVSGYVQKLYVDWGAHVKAGQLLAVLEIPELQQQLEQDQAAVRRNDHDLARAHDELSRAQSAHAVAHLSYTRLEQVQKTRPELVAQQEVDEAQGKDLEAEAGVSSAKDALASAEQGLAASKAALEKDRALYDYSRITAPFDGVVTEIDAYTGALLPAGTSSNKGDLALCKLAQNSLLRLVIPLPERAVSHVRVGEPVAIRITANNRTLQGKIVRFSDEIDPDTRTMRTEVDVPNPDYTLVPGMYASVEVPLEQAKNVLALPIQAVQASGEGQGTVLLVDSNHRLQKRSVTLGLQGPGELEIRSGLKEGDEVVFGEQSEYKAGQMITPKLTNTADVEP